MTIRAYENYIVPLCLNHFILANTETPNVKMCDHFSRSILFIFRVPYTWSCPVSCKKGKTSVFQAEKCLVFFCFAAA